MRNSACLGHDPIQPFHYVIEANRLATLIQTCFLSIGPSNAPPRQVVWHASKEDIHVLNVDGSRFEESGRAGFGGLLRSGGGDWIVGFSGCIGISDCAQAELMEILKAWK